MMIINFRSWHIGLLIDAFFHNISCIISSNHSWVIDANISFEHNAYMLYFQRHKLTQENNGTIFRLTISFSPVKSPNRHRKVSMNFKWLIVRLGLTVSVCLKVSNCKYAAYKNSIKTTIRRHFVWRTKKRNHSCWNYRRRHGKDCLHSLNGKKSSKCFHGGPEK